jgi:uncharacterized protein YndB with AHSA1/START domain
MVDLNHIVPINASAAKVFSAVATTEGNRGWWTADSKVDSKVGGKAEFGFDDRSMVFRMTLDKLVPDREVVMSCYGDNPEWNGTTLTWTILQDGEQTLLKFTHSNWRSMTDFCARCNSMWGHLMYRLKAFAETGHVDPQWTH